jgi:hypothetical protein
MGASGVWKRIARRATTMNYINQDKTAIIDGVWEFSRTTLIVSSIDRAYISKSLLNNPGATFCGARVRITPFILPLENLLTNLILCYG